MNCYKTFVFILILGISCSDEDTTVVPEGTYSGIFFRSINGVDENVIDENVANITLTLNDNLFSGSSDSERYPAICHGQYRLENDHTIKFTNGCAWTADFDWTLILDGTFVLSETPTYIYLVEELGDGIKNTYRLTK